MKNLLLLSNSRMPTTGYLEHAVEAIRETIGGAKRVVLIPYASVVPSEAVAWDATTANVRAALSSLDIEITAIHHYKIAATALDEPDAIMVNGGNTFNLLRHLRRNELIVPLRTQMLAGKPYVGWSAGSAICRSCAAPFGLFLVLTLFRFGSQLSLGFFHLSFFFVLGFLCTLYALQCPCFFRPSLFFFFPSHPC